MIAPEPLAERRGLTGHVRLVAAMDHKGRTCLKAQSFAAPFHLSKPFEENGVLVVNVVNPTAGLFRADTTRAEIRVESGARLLLATPSATRVYNTQGGRSVAGQEMHVATGAWLEILPELFIPHRGARHRQRTRIEVSKGGELCLLEMIAPGRVAFGEAFAFDELDWRTEIFHAERLIVRERFILARHNGSIQALLAFSPHPYVANFFLVTTQLTPASKCWDEINSLHGKGRWVGFSQLSEGGWTVRVVCNDSVGLRGAVRFIREKIHASCCWPLPLARRL